MPTYAGARFIDKAHADCLFNTGFCAFVLTAEERECNHPDVGDIVSFLLEDSSRGLRCSARLIADQDMPGGGCVSIYAAACSTYVGQP